MKHSIGWAAVAALLVVSPVAAAPRTPAAADLAPVGNLQVAEAAYQGRKAIRVEDLGPPNGQTDKLVRLKGATFGNGEIELWVAGSPGPGANTGARGFVGVMFRLSDDGKGGEAFYLRPTNGRAEDQERRNHAAQYISAPDWPWERTRRETPSRYEAYVDLEPGRWTRMRIVVDGARARLFVDGASQPTLIVNDLKGGAERTGGVALWIGPGTIAHFAEVDIRPK
ncbi:MAG: hypothetical protein JNK30_05115 [Phenylobacterium sp.]|uniref:hypothetical protein n=1 Tax=Phenylobacterium sp. TaxID=1871053 RepID=UPI001A610BDD|nr:hypothetical protein [Phenylobacterium sp.]MBL8770741.1 hypothetical protein [Phenylobacterium sp.]